MIHTHNGATITATLSALFTAYIFGMISANIRTTTVITEVVTNIPTLSLPTYLSVTIPASMEAQILKKLLPSKLSQSKAKQKNILMKQFNIIRKNWKAITRF